MEVLQRTEGREFEALAESAVEFKNILYSRFESDLLEIGLATDWKLWQCQEAERVQLRVLSHSNGC
jgi:hypothetical protein